MGWILHFEHFLHVVGEARRCSWYRFPGRCRSKEAILVVIMERVLADDIHVKAIALAVVLAFSTPMPTDASPGFTQIYAIAWTGVNVIRSFGGRLRGNNVSIVEHGKALRVIYLADRTKPLVGIHLSRSLLRSAKRGRPLSHTGIFGCTAVQNAKGRTGQRLPPAIIANPPMADLAFSTPFAMPRIVVTHVTVFAVSTSNP